MTSATRTKKTSSKSSSLKSGLSKREIMQNLNSSISLAKGLLATLSTNDPYSWTLKCETSQAREHTRMLLQEVMEEIWNADQSLSRLQSKRS